MKQALLASTAMLLVAWSAMAGERSSGLAIDDKQSHIKVFKYSPTKRYEVIGLMGQPTTFTFSPEEQVFAIVQTKLLGGQDNFVTAWEAPCAKANGAASEECMKTNPLGRNLTLWPMKKKDDNYVRHYDFASVQIRQSG